MRHERHPARLLTALLLALPAAALANPTIFQPKTQQCDGTYASGGATRRNNPLVTVQLQDADAGVGLRVNRSTSSFYTGLRLGDHFEDQYRVEVSSCDPNNGNREIYAWYYADKTGVPDQGLLGAYFDNINFSNLVVLRADATVNQSGTPDPSMGASQFAQRWTGYVLPTGASGAYQICVQHSDGARVYLSTGGVELNIIDRWSDQASVQHCSAFFQWTSGQGYQIAVEHYENNSGTNPNVLQLEWNGPGIPANQIIPAANLRPYLVPKIGQCTYSGANCTGATLALDGGNDAQNVPRSHGPPGFACPASTGTAASPSIPLSAPATVPPVTASQEPFSFSTGAFTLNGSSDFFELPVGAQWYLPPTYAISAWIKTANAGTQRIISQQNAAGQFWLFRTAGGRLDVEDSRDAGGPAAQGPASLADNNWHFIAAVRTDGGGASIGWKYFVDGALVFTGVAPSTSTQIMGLVSDDNGVSRAYIGALEGPAAPAGGSERFNGIIDDLRIYPGQISDDTLLMDYAANAFKYSHDAGANFGVSTSPYSGAASNMTTSVVTLAPTNGNDSNSRYVFVAQGSDGAGTVTSPSFGVSVDNSVPAAPTITANPTSATSITWTFTDTKLCQDTSPGPPTFNFTLKDASSGSTIGTTANGSFTFIENFVAVPNQLHTRDGTALDVWGTSALGPATTAYTRAADPTGLSLVSATGNSISLTWNTNLNPGYTRYELSMSLDNFTSAAVSTPVPISANFTGNSYTATGLSPGTAYYFRVRAISGRATDTFGDIFTNFSFFSTFTTPNAPVTNGFPISNTRIDWHWADIPGASSYDLYSAGAATPFVTGIPSPGGPPCNCWAGADVMYSSTGLLTNNLYGLQLRAVNGGGSGPLSPAAYSYTLALPPAAMNVTGVSTNSASFQWDAGAAPPLANPSYTFYEVNVATDSAFGVVVATKTTQQLTMTVGGLFPASTYYARVRAFSGLQTPTNPVAVAGSTVTNADASTSLSTSPPSAYVPPGNEVGLWQFDEGSGTTARDSTNNGNTAKLTCLINGCVSTPTFVGGPAGLGTAAGLTGQTSSLVLINGSAQYEFADALSLGAWVNPNTAAMPAGAAIVAKGAQGNESFSLDVVGGQYRFIVRPGLGNSLTAPTALDLGAWHRLLATWDGANARFFIDGQLVAGPLAVGGARLINQCGGGPCAVGIGSRKSNTGAYDLGFSGAIDSVLIVHRALSAAEALADYQGAFPGTTTLPPPNNKVKLTLPPNSFGAPALIYASNDPVGHPIRVDAVELANGLLNLPTGQALVPGSLIEIVPTVGGLPFTLPLGSSATLTLPYNDAGGRGLLDGVSPPISVSTLRVYTLDTSVGRWNALPTTVDAANRAVNATTPHFSLFGLFGATTIGATLSQARVYPKPWIIGSTSKFGADNLTFDKLPANGVVRIFNLSGERLIELSFSSQNAGKLLWNGNNFNGHPAASGVYFAYIQDADTGSTAVVKFAIER